jgi:hypothetical protein
VSSSISQSRHPPFFSKLRYPSIIAGPPYVLVLVEFSFQFFVNIHKGSYMRPAPSKAITPFWIDQNRVIEKDLLFVLFF